MLVLDSRDLVANIDPKEDIIFVIAHADVVFGLEVFDKIILKHQRLDFVGDDRVVDVGNLRDHEFDPGSAIVVVFFKVRRHTIFEFVGFAHVQQITLVIVETIYTRFLWEFGNFLN